MDLLRLLPPFWYQGRETSESWDRALNKALDIGITSVGPHEAIVGPFTVWIANYPYAFGFNRADALELLPKVRTRIRLRRAIEQFHDRRYAEQFPVRHDQKRSNLSCPPNEP